ncbi:MAG: hypothetical protein KA371_04195 [Acidobacteria bacterium]|nr:hypothetical protein [Acidobacteriota bacterium]
MIPALRARFNREWTPRRHETLLAELEARAGVPLGFPVSETPCFFPAALLDEMATTGASLVTSLLANSEAQASAEALVPARYLGPGQETTPTCVQVDFGLVRELDGRLTPRLVELQAFPSLYAFQHTLAVLHRELYELPETCAAHAAGLDDLGYRQLVGDVLAGRHDPTEVALLEIAPEQQKTRPDFALTERLWGITTVDPRDVIVRGRTLWRRHDGRETPIRRIYNRVIPDELERTGHQMAFDYRDDLDVEWVGHPAWYFRLSKSAIPWLVHPSVPRTWRLDAVEALPEDRNALVLKPLFSFAGGGIVFAPSDQDLAAIPASQRHLFLLQERVKFEPVIDTPHGMTQAEVRIMYVWTDRLRAVLPLIRMGRGQMMGVAHNRGLAWVGASAGFAVTA